MRPGITLVGQRAEGLDMGPGDMELVGLCAEGLDMGPGVTLDGQGAGGLDMGPSVWVAASALCQGTMPLARHAGGPLARHAGGTR
jgi:hypothetical protein